MPPSLPAEHLSVMPAGMPPEHLATEHLQRHLERWGLQPDGPLTETATSVLLPVRRGPDLALLKVARVDEERVGGRLMAWWDGRGAARVLEHDDSAVLLERATGPRSLTVLAGTDVGSPGWERDDVHATQVLCDVARTLHAVDDVETQRPEHLTPLTTWFRELLALEGERRGFVHRSAVVARGLLADPWDETVLHGDLHHGNVLDFGTVQSAQWRAIDPKSLVGERGFDLANIVCNPSTAAATAPGRLSRQVLAISEATDVDRVRLLQWVVAWTGLSATWHGESTDAGRAARAVVIQVGRTAEDLLRAM